jgi:hypothetical protein
VLACCCISALDHHHDLVRVHRKFHHCTIACQRRYAVAGRGAAHYEHRVGDCAIHGHVEHDPGQYSWPGKCSNVYYEHDQPAGPGYLHDYRGRQQRGLRRPIGQCDEPCRRRHTLCRRFWPRGQCRQHSIAAIWGTDRQDQCRCQQRGKHAGQRKCRCRSGAGCKSRTRARCSQMVPLSASRGHEAVL